MKYACCLMATGSMSRAEESVWCFTEQAIYTPHHIASNQARTPPAPIPPTHTGIHGNKTVHRQEHYRQNKKNSSPTLLKTVNTFSTKHLKKQYLSAKHVTRTPEYRGYMGSTQSISRTIQPIGVKLSQNVANI